MNYFLINFNETDVNLWDLKADINPKYKVNALDSSTSVKLQKKDKVIVLRNANQTKNSTGGYLKATGIVNDKGDGVDIVKKTLIEEDVPFTDSLKTELNLKISKPQNNDKQRVYQISEGDYKILENFLKERHESKKYYYFALNGNDFEIFTGKTNIGSDNVCGKYKLKLKCFEDKTKNNNYNTQPNKGDLALIFHSTGQDKPQPAKFKGVIQDINKQDINKNGVVTFHVYPLEEFDYTLIPKNDKLITSFATQKMGKNFGPKCVSKDDFERMLSFCYLLEQRNIVFNGAPGTGKTYMAKQIAKKLGAETKFVQFHPSYDYTDFVEGLRPVLLNNQQNAQSNGVNQGNMTTIGFERRDGIFKDFCAKAAQALAASIGKEIDWQNGELNDSQQGLKPLKKFVFIIDEINRGDMSKIFGELFYSIEKGYRVKADKLGEALKENSEYSIQTQYQNLIKAGEPFKNGFFVPDNVYIIGTMNDIDRSVESMDFAMRRRFKFVEILPEDATGMLYSTLNNNIAKEAITKMNAINKIISEKIGPEYQIGPAYFRDLKDDSDFNSLWTQRILPLIKEYRRGEDKAETQLLIDELKKAYDDNQNQQ